MKQYLDLCQRIIYEGEMIYNERTGKNTLTVINADLEYDVGNKQFPLVTTRKSFYKAAIAELIGYIRGYDNASDFRKLGTPTWDANSNENEVWLDNPFRKGEDDMGLAYRFRTKGYFDTIPTIRKEYPKTQVLGRFFEECELDFSQNKHNLIGKEFISNSGFKYKVIKEHFKNNSETCVFDIQFNISGYIKQNVHKNEILEGEVKDFYSPTVKNVACLGNLDNLNQDFVKLLKPVWNNMITRCYNDNDEIHKNYKNIFVDDRWLVFENFVKDFTSTHNWQLKAVFPEEYTLDKDWCNSNFYSKNTVRWATALEQSMNTSNTNTFLAKNLETNETFYYKGVSKFVKEYDVPKNLCNVFSGYKEGDTFEKYGWEFTKLNPNEVRYIEVDQVKLIYAKLKLGIDDRRLIMTAWLPHTEGLTCLMPCMHTHTFSLVNGTLHLTSYQRSCDVPLGLNFNMVQVYVLLALMAQITGHKAGKAYHKIVNAHFYEDQIELMRDVQLKREPFPLPELKINPDIKTLEDLETWVTMDDFELVGYQHHPAIKYPFSV